MTNDRVTGERLGWNDGMWGTDGVSSWGVRWFGGGSGAHGIGASPAEAISQHWCMGPYACPAEGDRYFIGIAYVGIYALWVSYLVHKYSRDEYCGGLNVFDRSGGADGIGATYDLTHLTRRCTIIIRRRRYSRRWRRGSPAARIRARCRRVEAYFAMWLLCSNHLAMAQYGSRRGSTGWTYGERDMTGDGRCCMPDEPTHDCATAEDMTMYDVARFVIVTGTGDRLGRNGSAPGDGIRWWTRGARVGEAANPGPASATMVAEGLLRRVYSSARAAIKYPRPGENSLSRTVTPGYQASREPGEEGGAMALTIETVNTTGWRALQRRLLTSDSYVVLAQETWLTQDALPAASAWALRNGWQSIWTAAVPGPQGGASGGAAVFVRTGLGLRYPPGMTHIWWPGRVVAAMVDAPGHRPLLLISCYLIHGVGPSEGNLQILADMGQRLRAIGGGHEVVIAGDINMEPPDLADTGFAGEVDATIMCPPTSRGTFRTARSSSMLDYFIISNRTAAAVDKVETVEGSGVRGHVPVVLTFKAKATALKALHLRRPPRLGDERVYGPVPPPPCWTQARRAAEDALAEARKGGPDVQDKLDKAYQEWANLAEEEIAGYVGEAPKKWGERGLLPRLVWRSAIPEAAPVKQRPYAAAAAWLVEATNEVRRIAAAVEPSTVGTNIDTDEGHGGDDVDNGDDVDDQSAEEELRRARARRPPRRPANCTEVLRDMALSLDRDCPQCGDDDAGNHLTELRGKVADMVNELGRLISGGGYDAGRMDEAAVGFRRTLDALHDEIKSTEVRLSVEAAAEDRRKWKEWVSEGADKGAARAHAYSRLPTAWSPSVAVRPDGTPSSAVDDLMQDQREKHKRLWKPADEPFHYQWSAADELPRISVERLRNSSRTFARRTATTFDGFHPRMLGNLSDEALETLAAILAAVEASAVWPRQVSLVVAVLLPKAKGGFRPIGLAPAVYRLWAKVRKEEADEWERKHPRAYFAACKGSGSVEVMWKLAAKGEAAASDGDVAATITEDVQAFFEGLDRDRLVGEARALDFPIPVLKAALAAYASARILSMNGRMCREMYPTAGVLAGCSLAMALTKLYCVRAFDEVVADAAGDAMLDTFVDDLTISAIGKPAAVVADLLRVHSVLKDIVTTTLGCNFADGKAAVTATTRSVAASIARGMGLQGGVAATATVLGIDSTAGATRSTLGRASTRAKRLRAALARKKRLLQLRRALGDRARKIFVAGVQPAASHGAQVWGLDDAEVRKLRRVAASTLRPGGRCRSLATTLLWHGLPTAAAEHAPLIQLARMTWEAVTCRERAEDRGASISCLRQWWEAAMVQAEPLVKHIEQKRAEAVAMNREVPLSATRSCWRKARGPIAAAALTAERIGWRFVSPFRIVDHVGAEMLLTDTPPALVRKRAEEALLIALEKKVARGLTEEEPRFQGRGACIEIVSAAVRNSRSLTAYQKGMMRAVTCGAVMTGARAVRSGYDVTGLCPLCKQALDTLTHRVYECPCSEAAVRAVVPNWFWHEARRSAAGCRFWTTGVCPNPADLAPPPEAEMNVIVEKVGNYDDADEVGNIMAIRGRAYIDGSCTTPSVKRLARAACGIAQTNDRGEPQKLLHAAVPRHLPQTAQAAEHLGYALVVKAVEQETTVVGDCMNVVQAANAGRGALAPSRVYAGLVLSTFSQPRKRRMVGTVEWTRAHRTLAGDEDPDTLRDIKGNDAADAAAKAALAYHPPIGVDAARELEFYDNRVKHVIEAVVTAMQLFPRAPGDMPRAPRPTTVGQAAQRDQHCWEHVEGAWRCKRCQAWSNSCRLSNARKYQRCTGRTIADDAEAMAAKGHDIYRADAGIPFVFCGGCGAWGHKRTHKLAAGCGPPAPSGIQALNRIRKGLHPLQRRGYGGALLQRENVRISARFDAATRRWVSMTDVVEVHLESNPTPMRDDVTNAAVSTCTITGASHSADIAADADESMRDVMYMEMGMPVSPHIAENADEDVFGHGGSLDQPPLGGAESEAREVSGGSPGILDDGPFGAANHAPPEAAHDLPPPKRSRRGLKSIWERASSGHAEAAIQRSMIGSRPPSGDAAERIRAVRRRIVEKAQNRMEAAEAATMSDVRSSPADLAGGADRDASCLTDATKDKEDASTASGVNTAPCQIGGGSDERRAASFKPRGEMPMLEVRAVADDAQHSVGIARAGPGGPPLGHSTGAVTPHCRVCVAAPVVAGGVVAELITGQLTREAVAERGEATRGPPCGAAAPQDGTLDTCDIPWGRSNALTSQTLPHTEGGGRPPNGHHWTSPQDKPSRLGAGPSTLGREDREEDGGRPTRSREEAGRRCRPRSPTSAARGSGDAAAWGWRDKPLKGFCRQSVQGARQPEWGNIGGGGEGREGKEDEPELVCSGPPGRRGRDDGITDICAEAADSWNTSVRDRSPHTEDVVGRREASVGHAAGDLGGSLAGGGGGNGQGDDRRRYVQLRRQLLQRLRQQQWNCHPGGSADCSAVKGRAGQRRRSHDDDADVQPSAAARRRIGVSMKCREDGVDLDVDTRLRWHVGEEACASASDDPVPGAAQGGGGAHVGIMDGDAGSGDCGSSNVEPGAGDVDVVEPRTCAPMESLRRGVDERAASRGHDRRARPRGQGGCHGHLPPVRADRPHDALPEDHVRALSGSMADVGRSMRRGEHDTPRDNCAGSGRAGPGPDIGLECRVLDAHGNGGGQNGGMDRPHHIGDRADDERRRVQPEAKRRRLYGKQAAPGLQSQLGFALDAADARLAASPLPRARDGANSVHDSHASDSGGPPRSSTSTCYRVDDYDRGGHELPGRIGRGDDARGHGPSQHGAGRDDVVRGRGRPPE